MPRALIAIYVITFLGFSTAIGFWPSGSMTLITEFGVFFVLGLFGALVANSTGAGGGVVFIPFFAALGFNSLEAVGTSMAIQCCGMSAGTLAWLTQIHRDPTAFHCTLPIIHRLLLISGIATMAGVLLGQYGLPHPTLEVAHMFRWFSIVFGLVLFAYTLLTRNAIAQHSKHLSPAAYGAVIVTAFAGGILTAWLSVGVGECLALLLFFLGFSAKLAVAIGVFSSAVSVLTGVIYHLFITHTVVLEVFLFAGQAALIGGYLARHITLWLGGFRLKLFFAVWIFLSGLFIA